MSSTVESKLVLATDNYNNVQSDRAKYKRRIIYYNKDGELGIEKKINDVFFEKSRRLQKTEAVSYAWTRACACKKKKTTTIKTSECVVFVFGVISRFLRRQRYNRIITRAHNNAIIEKTLLARLTTYIIIYV